MHISNKVKYSLNFLFVLFLITNIFFVQTIAEETDSKPDLIILPTNIPKTLTEGQAINISVIIKNIGNRNITDDKLIEIGLFIDYGSEPVSFNSTETNLEINETYKFILNFVPTIGDGKEHTLSLVVDYNDKIDERNNIENEGENNNVADFISKFDSKPTELEIIDIIKPNNIFENKTTPIRVRIKNLGKDTTDLIIAKLFIDDQLKATKEKDIVLKRGNECNFYFNWTPIDFGSKSIRIEIYLQDDLEDELEIPIIVKVTELEWWNPNWHYRYFLTVEGTGVISNFFNFTEELNNIGLESKNFENETLRIVQYSLDGKVAKVIEDYNFNESLKFNATYNSTGTLFWKIDDSGPNEKYFCIYFDVSENDGQRTDFTENDSLIVDGNAIVKDQGDIEGWQTSIISPLNASYTLTGDLINITVETQAIADSVEAFLFLNSNISQNFTVDLFNYSQGTIWKYNNLNFSIQGNWTIQIISKDKAGFQPIIAESVIFVGKPDLIVKDIIFSTNYIEDSDIFFKEDLINITIKVTSIDANIEKTDLLLSIIDTNSYEVIHTKLIENITVFKDKINYISYNWSAVKIGEFFVNVSLDTQNLVNERNESNNNFSDKIRINGIPDLFVKEIILPIKSLEEFERIKIEAVIYNQGEGKANDYEVRLYIESAFENEMYYTDEKDTNVVSVNVNSSKKVDLYWDSARPGVWRVGIKIISTAAKKDSNFLNNQAFFKENLTVRGFERNNPIISNLRINPKTQEQGGFIRIIADITDDSGIDFVNLIVNYPSDEEEIYSMPRTKNEDEFAFTFSDTLDIGIYNFQIEVTDLSVHGNTAILNDSFTIKEDNTDPEILYLKAAPYVQLSRNFVDIICKAVDNIDINSVKVSIDPPKGSEYIREMQKTNTNRYEFSENYSEIGKYSFKVEIKDKAGNKIESENQIFWITNDLNDIDSDGMPNWWEEKYNFNPEDSSDASADLDKDGYSNLKEYEIGTNPEKDIFAQNLAYRIKDSVAYIISSILVFTLIFLVFLYSKRRV
jgi:hypothetical protein